MRNIKRKYLQKLIGAVNTPDIKVITGVRRCGKSVLLEQFAEYVREHFPKANIISLDFNSVEYEEYRNYKALHEYVEARYQPRRRNFLFIDEVQMCDGFERAINSLHNMRKYDIYITGSNAFLSSSDLATLFTGRTYTIEVFPFSLQEFMEYYRYKDAHAAFDKYFYQGGMAGSYAYGTQEDRYNYLSEVYRTLIVRDIQQKYGIQNLPLLNNLSDFLMDNISKLTSVRNITNVLKANRVETSDKTVGAYINYLCNAYAFYRMKRYDVRGKAYLYSQDKYYLADHAWRFALLGTKTPDYGNVYENIVALELMRRGYEVYVGTLRGGGIDFVAKRRDEKYYIQVSYDLSSEQTLAREVKSLLDVKDAYPKLILARTRQPEYLYEGIRVLDIADWLVGE